MALVVHPLQLRARQRWPHANSTHVCTPPRSFPHCANVWAITCSYTRIGRGELWDHGDVRAVTLVSDWRGPWEDPAPEVVPNRPKSDHQQTIRYCPDDSFHWTYVTEVLWHGRCLGSRVGQASSAL